MPFTYSKNIALDACQTGATACSNSNFSLYLKHPTLPQPLPPRRAEGELNCHMWPVHLAGSVIDIPVDIKRFISRKLPSISFIYDKVVDHTLRKKQSHIGLLGSLSRPAGRERAGGESGVLKMLNAAHIRISANNFNYSSN
jgi:hypothetical protein